LIRPRMKSRPLCLLQSLTAHLFLKDFIRTTVFVVQPKVKHRGDNRRSLHALTLLLNTKQGKVLASH